MKIPYLISLYFSFIIISSFYDFNDNASNAHHREIVEVIKAIIKESQIQQNFPDFKIYSKLPKYISRRELEEFVPGPPPGSPYIFPDIEQIIKLNLPNYTISSNDFQFFKEQDESSLEIWLNDLDFPEYSLAKKENLIPEEYIYFSIPVFNFDKIVAYVRVGFFCGGECGWGGEMILKKGKAEKWRIVKNKNFWVS
ncbi:hypothetical protein [Algoriphagus sp. PAP.12]|uniref:hypothetical protein n=1 Tax=Algoriphagus sp. PAP.12 TaxID=2996678 RepID=UPI00227A537C|nr:hypothetical protein [Algoriphagus sp. PAP.12]